MKQLEYEIGRGDTMFKNTNKEAGVVSLFTVLFFTILITVLTVGFLRVMISEQRQSTDDDLTTRAFYAAESGVEDAKRALLQYYPNVADRVNLNEGSCDAPVGYNKVIEPELSVGYSCMLLDTSPPDIQATLPGDNTSMQWKISPEGAAAYDRVQVSWHGLSDDNDGDQIGLRSNSVTLPQASEWRGCTEFGPCDPSETEPFAAMMRMQIFGTIRGGATTQAQLEQYNGAAFINPNMLDSEPEAVINYNNDMYNDATRVGEPINTFCTTDPDVYDGYACRATIMIDNFAANSLDLNLRLKSIYDINGTQVKVELLNGTSNVNIADAQALVDVTGYAGDVFRRVQARVNLPSTGITSLAPEYVIDSGDDICKRFEVSQSSEQLNGCVVR